MIKLLYIYIHDTANIQKQGFNLSSDFSIDFDFKYDKSQKQYFDPILTISKTPTKLPHIFHDKISDIKGIVGENGAGKSTLLHYLAFKGHENDVQLFGEPISYDLLVYLKSDENSAKVCIQAGKLWQLVARQIINNTTLIIEPHFLTTNDYHISWREIQDFGKTSFIFYSNVFDNKPEIAFNDLLNISTNCLSRSDAQSWTANRVRVSDVEAHRIMEGRRQLEFAIAYKDKLPFKTPDNFLIYFNGHSQILIRNKIQALTADKDNASPLLKPLEQWVSLSEQYGTIYKSQLIKRLVHQAFFSSLILNYVIDEHPYTDSYFVRYPEYLFEVLSEILKLYEKGKGVINLSDLIAFAIKLESPLVGHIDINGSSVQVGLGASSLSRAIELFKQFNDALSKSYKSKPQILNNGILIKIDDESIDLYSKYVKSVYLTHYLDFSFPGLSSGELGYLTLFSRFFSLVSGAKSISQEIEDYIDDIIILIDEGDLYFHPKWQTEYIKYLDTVLPIIFKGKNLQIILTSHSQFLASDLPVQNLVFLKKEHDAKKKLIDGKFAFGTCQVVPGPSFTFAANIHDLLADTFFLKGAHIGEFAKDIIYKIMDQLDGKEKQLWTNEQILAIIDQIGESFIKSRLMEKYNNAQSTINQ